MSFTNQIDDELCKSIIEKRDLLLSSNALDHSSGINDDQICIDFFSMLEDENSSINLGLTQAVTPINSIFNSSQNSVNNERYQQISNDQIGIKDEIIDSDLFEFLRSEDPDVISLLETLSDSDLVKPAYLPQISVNTTNQVLNNEIFQPEAQHQLSIFNLTDDCLKQEVKSPEIPTTNLPAADITPSRVSLRLIKRRNNGNLRLFSEMVKPKKEPKRLNGPLKQRKRSIDEEDIDENGSLFSNENSNDNSTYKSVDNSISYDSDEHIYFDDEDFNPDHCDNSNERDFQEFVLNYNQKNKRDEQLDPTKKDANKEAATRYRLKKLSEKDKMFETRMLLEKENDEIKRRCELVTTEINYLKNLLVQMLLTKGMMSDKLEVF